MFFVPFMTYHAGHYLFFASYISGWSPLICHFVHLQCDIRLGFRLTKLRDRNNWYDSLFIFRLQTLFIQTFNTIYLWFVSINPKFSFFSNRDCLITWWDLRKWNNFMTYCSYNYICGRLGIGNFMSVIMFRVKVIRNEHKLIDRPNSSIFDSRHNVFECKTLFLSYSG